MSDETKIKMAAQMSEDQNLTLIAEIGSGDANEELNSGQNSVVSEVFIGS